MFGTAEASAAHQAKTFEPTEDLEAAQRQAGAAGTDDSTEAAAAGADAAAPAAAAAAATRVGPTPEQKVRPARLTLLSGQGRLGWACCPVSMHVFFSRISGM